MSCSDCICCLLAKSFFATVLNDIVSLSVYFQEISLINRMGRDDELCDVVPTYIYVKHHAWKLMAVLLKTKKKIAWTDLQMP